MTNYSENEHQVPWETLPIINIKDYKIPIR